LQGTCLKKKENKEKKKKKSSSSLLGHLSCLLPAPVQESMPEQSTEEDEEDRLLEDTLREM